MPPRCRRCKEPEALDKPLFKCVHCSNHYHSACHRPHPKASINWVCKRCFAGQRGQGGRLGHYHEKLLSSTRAASHSSAPPGRDDSRIARMAPTAVADLARTSAAAITTQISDSPGAAIRCSFPGCPAKIGRRQVLCEAHHRQAISPTNDTLQEAVRANGIPAPTPTSDPNAARQLTFDSNPRMLWQATDQNGPIMRRETAGEHPPQLVPPQPTPKASTPPSRHDSIMSSRSPPPPASRPSVHSPPPSPGHLDGEPARKRPRLSLSPGRSPQARVNGTARKQQPIESFSSKRSLEPNSPQSSRRAPDHSATYPGKVREREGKPGVKLGGRHFMRRLPLNLTSLRFLDAPGGGPPNVSPERPSSGVNGSTGALPRRSSGLSELPIDGPIISDSGRDIGSPSPSVAHIRSVGSPGHAFGPPYGSEEDSPGALPEKERPDTQNGYGPFQANGAATSGLRSKEVHFPIRPAPLTEARRLQLPKPKEIDTSRFDALVYSQPGASSPPPDVNLTPADPPPPTAQARQPPKDEPLYLDIDPRVHWPQPHSPAWHAAKQEEIRARGKKKANFGRAAQSLRRQQQLQQQEEQQRDWRRQDTDPFEEKLPEKIRENPAWVRALRRLKGLPPISSSSSRSVSSLSSLSVAGDGEAGVWVNGSVPAAEMAPGLQRKGGGRKTAAGAGTGGVTAKRVGSTGVVVITGLSAAQLGGGRRFGRDAN